MKGRYDVVIIGGGIAGHYAIWPGGVIFSALSGRIVAKGIYGGFWRQLLI